MKTPDDFSVPGGDDTAAVQAWANAGGGAWPRAYRVSGILTFPEGTVLRGDSKTSVLEFDASCPDAILLTINGKCDIRGLRIDAAAIKRPVGFALAFLEGAPNTLSDVVFANVSHAFALGIIDVGHRIADVRYENVVQGVWDGGIGTKHRRLTFRGTKAACFVAGGTGTKIFGLDAEDFGECVMMTNQVNRDCELHHARWRRGRRLPTGDQGCGIEVWGGWLFDHIDGADVDWSHFVIFDPEDVTLRNIRLRNPGQWSNAAVRPGNVVTVPEPGLDPSACIKIYLLEPTAKPRNVYIDYRLLTDQSGTCNAITILGATGSQQIEDLYIVGGAMPGRWKNGQAVDVRQAATDGVTRSVCGGRCYHGNTPLPLKPPTKELEPA